METAATYEPPSIYTPPATLKNTQILFRNSQAATPKSNSVSGSPSQQAASQTARNMRTLNPHRVAFSVRVVSLLWSNMIEERFNYFLSVTSDPTAAAVLVLTEALSASALQDTLTVDQAGARIGVHSSTIRKRIKDGSLPVQRVGRAIRIKAVDLQTMDSEKPTRKFRCLKMAS